MVNFRGMVVMAAIAALMAFGSTACNDDDRGGGGSTTTSTTATSTTSTTTTSSTTSTTMGGPTGFTCDVTFSVTSGETIGALQYDVDYDGSAQPGEFTGSADLVDCTPNAGLGGVIATFNDDEAAPNVLSTAVIALTGFTGPIDVATCEYIKCNAIEPVAGDFPITLVDASDTSFGPITPGLAATLNCVPGGGGCAPASTTTTTTTTTTTSTTTTSTTTTTTAPSMGGGSFAVAFQVEEANNYGALQYDVDYTGAPGGFEGAADSVTCAADGGLGGVIATFNDNEGTTTLSSAIISLGGFAGPTTVATCTFVSTGAAPVAGDFTITVIDASDSGLLPINPLPTVSIESIVAL
jgi:hypothetical protein